MIMFTNLKKRINRKKSFQSIMKFEFNDENTINKKENRCFRQTKFKRKKIYIDVQFNLKNDFIYHIDERRRLCISISCKKKIFRIIHDNNHHVDRHRFYQFIFDVLYVSRLFKKFRRYLKHCFQCQFNQIKKYRFYEKLIFIINFLMSFHIIVINFIMIFSNAYDALLIVTNKLFRRIFFIIDHTTYETKN